MRCRTPRWMKVARDGVGLCGGTAWESIELSGDMLGSHAPCTMHHTSIQKWRGDTRKRAYFQGRMGSWSYFFLPSAPCTLNSER